MPALDVRRITPLVGPPARRRILAAQALNLDIDDTLDEDDEERALRLWRPLARAYPDDLAVMHGYVLALCRRYEYAERPELLDEYLAAATRLAEIDRVSSQAVGYAAQALLDAGQRYADATLLARSEACFIEAERRAKPDRRTMAYYVHGRSKVFAARNDLKEAKRLKARALKLDPGSDHYAFDAEE